MAQVPGRTVSGKKLVPILLVGIVVFFFVMNDGLKWFGEAMTPWLKARFERNQAAEKARRAEDASSVTP